MLLRKLIIVVPVAIRVLGGTWGTGGSGTLGGLITWPNTRQNLMMGASMGVRPAVQAIATNVVAPATTNGTYPFQENTNGTAPEYLNGPGDQVSIGVAGPPSYPVVGLPVLSGGMPAGNANTGSRPPQLPGLPTFVQPAQLPGSSNATMQASNRGPQSTAGQFPVGVTQQASSSTSTSTLPSTTAGAQAASLPQARPTVPNSEAAGTGGTAAGGIPYANDAHERGIATGTQTQEAGQGRVSTTRGVSAGAPLVPGSEPLTSNGTELAGGATGTAVQPGSSGEARGQPSANIGLANQGVSSTVGASGSSVRPTDAPGIQAGPGATTTTPARLPGAAGAGATGAVGTGTGPGTGIGPGQPGRVPGDPGVPGGTTAGGTNPSATGPGSGVTGGAPIIPLPADPGSITGPLSSLFGSTVAGSAAGVVGERRGIPAAEAKVAEILTQIRERTPFVQAPPDMATMALGSFPMDHDGARLLPGPPPPPGPPPSYINPRPGDVGGARISIDQVQGRVSDILTEGTPDNDPATSVPPSSVSIEAAQDAPGPTVVASPSHAGAVSGIFEVALPYHPDEAAAQSQPTQSGPPAAPQQPLPPRDVVLSAEQMKDLQDLEAAMGQSQPSVTPALTRPVNLDLLQAVASPPDNPPPVDSVDRATQSPVVDDSLPTTSPVQIPNPVAEDSAVGSQPSTFSVSQIPSSKDTVDGMLAPAERQADPATGLFVDMEHPQERVGTPAGQAASHITPALPEDGTVPPGDALRVATTAERLQREDSATLNDPLPSVESFPSIFLRGDPEEGPRVEGVLPMPPLFKSLASMLRLPRPTSFQESQSATATAHPKPSHTPAVSKTAHSTSKAPASKQKVRPTAHAAAAPAVSGGPRQSQRDLGTPDDITEAIPTAASGPGPAPGRADLYMHTPQHWFAFVPAIVPSATPSSALEFSGHQASSSLGTPVSAPLPGNSQPWPFIYQGPHSSAQTPFSQTQQRTESYAGAPVGTAGTGNEATHPLSGPVVPAYSPAYQSQAVPGSGLPTSLVAQTSISPYFASFPAALPSARYDPSLPRTPTTLSGQSDPVAAATYGKLWGVREGLPSGLRSQTRPVQPGVVTDSASELEASAAVTRDTRSRVDIAHELAPVAAYDFGLDDEGLDVEQTL